MKENLKELKEKRYGMCTQCKEIGFLFYKVINSVKGTYDNYWKLMGKSNKTMGYLCKECSLVEAI